MSSLKCMSHPAFLF